MRRLGRIFATSLLVLAMAMTVAARLNRPSRRSKAPPPPPTYVEGDVTKVEPDSNQLWIEPPSNRATIPILISSRTIISWGQAKLTLADVHPGDHATAKLLPGGESQRAAEIRIARPRSTQ